MRSRRTFTWQRLNRTEISSHHFLSLALLFINIYIGDTILSKHYSQITEFTSTTASDLINRVIWPCLCKCAQIKHSAYLRHQFEAALEPGRPTCIFVYKLEELRHSLQSYYHWLLLLLSLSGRRKLQLAESQAPAPTLSEVFKTHPRLGQHWGYSRESLFLVNRPAARWEQVSWCQNLHKYEKWDHEIRTEWGDISKWMLC